MSVQDKMDPDGIRYDGVAFDPAASHLPIYAEARQQLTSFREPV